MFEIDQTTRRLCPMGMVDDPYTGGYKPFPGTEPASDPADAERQAEAPAHDREE